MEDKSYRVKVSSDHDYDEIPAVAVFAMSEADAVQVVTFAALVKEHDLHIVERFDYSASFYKHDPETNPSAAEEAGEENERRTEMDCLCVSDKEFWFSACIRHTCVEVNTARQPIADLMTHFGMGVSPTSAANDEVPVGTAGQLVTIDGEAIQGTLESVRGVSGIASVVRNADGSLDIEHDGGTDIWWNGQNTKLTPSGETIFVSESGGEIPASKVKVVAGDA